MSGQEEPVRVVGWVVLGVVAVLLGALGGFAVSLLLPRRYGASEPRRLPG